MNREQSEQSISIDEQDWLKFGIRESVHRALFILHCGYFLYSEHLYYWSERAYDLSSSITIIISRVPVGLRYPVPYPTMYSFMMSVKKKNNHRKTLSFMPIRPSISSLESYT